MSKKKLSEQLWKKHINCFTVDKIKTYGEICMLEGKIEEANRIDSNLFAKHTKRETGKMHDFISGFRATGIYRNGLEQWESRLEEIKIEHELK